MTWVLNNLDLILQLTLQHIRLSIVPIVLGFVIALPLGWVAYRYRLTRGLVLTLVGLLYTIPSLALFVILPPLLGIGFLSEANVLIALTLRRFPGAIFAFRFGAVRTPVRDWTFTCRMRRPPPSSSRARHSYSRQALPAPAQAMSASCRAACSLRGE